MAIRDGRQRFEFASRSVDCAHSGRLRACPERSRMGQSPLPRSVNGVYARVQLATWSTPHYVTPRDIHRYLQMSCPAGPSTDCMTAPRETLPISFAHSLLPNRRCRECRRPTDDPALEPCRLRVLAER